MKFCPPQKYLFITALFIIFSGIPVHAAYNSAQWGSFATPSYQKEVLAEFSTKFNVNAKSRTHNLKLASIAIDQYEIMQGETFSFNEVVGYAGAEKGYEKAVVFVKGKEKKAYGGGICQVSSTLYNAAMNAGLEIVERHPHSKEVKYVEKGKDAATSYGSVDLKIRNNYDFPVVINTYISDNTFTVEILK